MASTLRSYGNNTIRERGVDVAILGVDMAILVVDIAILAILRMQEKWRGYRGGGEGEVSRVRRLEAGWSTPVSLEIPGATRGVERRVISRFR